jgi:hypothetical protein
VKKRRFGMYCGVVCLLFDYHPMIYVSVMFWTCWCFSRLEIDGNMA